MSRESKFPRIRRETPLPRIPLMSLTLNDLERLYIKTCAASTPHRHPHFPDLKRVARGGGNTLVKGLLVFIEEHNTGYDGVLYRYIFTISPKPAKAKTGTDDTGKISFQCDLLPGLVKMAPETTN